MAAGCNEGIDGGAAHERSQSLSTAHLVLLMGLPASGKTTAARNLQQQQQQQHQQQQQQHVGADINVVVHHICVDELYNACIAEAAPLGLAVPLSSIVPGATPAAFSPAVWHRSRSLALDKTRQLLTELLVSRADSVPLSASCLHLLLVDDVLHLRSMRRAYYRLARQLQVPFSQLMLDTPLPVCIERHTQRLAAVSASRQPSASHRSLTAATIASLHLAFQRPSASELPYSITLTPASSAVLQCQQLLSLTQSRGVVPTPVAEVDTRDQAAEQQQMRSALHQLDIAMRRKVGERVQAARAAAGGSRRERDALALNAVRQSVLQQARQPGSLVSELLKPDCSEEEEEQSAGVLGQAASKEAAVQLDRRMSRVLEYFTQLLNSSEVDSN